MMTLRSGSQARPEESKAAGLIGDSEARAVSALPGGGIVAATAARSRSGHVRSLPATR